ncbi:CRISPR-associated endonuclease Cas2 [Ectothiorhodospira haloalkaliphila]|uniref:CRISPR-associated endonuclease Cas2 n=1 Tax=Ectothiorhodospira haloalkaliphila TaxID=421628 RepID=UPI001EE7B9EE|nr:CRISPR-associated endonuclease Cas2 [Ectothiorhodospira haloalkaliphila]MCG5525950.1 CRISPR-associated endonuclease Cas2 [Ectothiorhodospira haloalkaliphila]
MFLLITYDVQADRTELYKRFLLRYLTHEQNSVFAGDLTESEYRKLTSELLKIADPEDRILQFKAKNRHNIEAAILSKNAGNGALEEKSLLHHSMNATII